MLKNAYKPITETHPELILQWDFIKNGGLKPENFTSGSNQIISWKCPVEHDHKWHVSIKSRCKPGKISTCPFCVRQRICLSNCLATTHPEIANFWDYDKNISTPYEISIGHNQNCFWKCPVSYDHEWSSMPRTLLRNHCYCPCCSGGKVCLSNCLATTHPHLISQWDESNETTPYEFTKGSRKRIFWKCSENLDHKWFANIADRTSGNGHGCPFCNNKKVCLSNCLATLNPELISQWDFENNELTPYDVVPKSEKIINWKCNKFSDHLWSAPVKSRTYGRGCPFCSGNKICLSNCLATTNPKLLTEWDYTANKKTPYEIGAGHTKDIFWICSKNKEHKWAANPSNRSNNKTGCPFCKESKGEYKTVEILKKLNLKFTKESKFLTCKDKRKLPFDFLVEIGFNLIILIEFQGEQHYKLYRYKDKAKAIRKFEEIKRHDLIKSNWANYNNIPLLTIPYWDIDKIETIIKDFIKKHMLVVAI